MTVRRVQRGPDAPRPFPLGRPRALPSHAAVVGVLFFASGAAALIYQVLWLRDLGVLFGATAEAAAVGLSVFFAGLAAGGAYWGRRAGAIARPLGAYAWLEAGVVATASMFLWLIDVYHWLYAPLERWFGAVPAALWLAKVALAAAVLFPPAALLGGTFPLMAAHVVRDTAYLGRSGSRLYALNTLGGALGALAAGFYLPMRLGFTGAYLVAMSISSGVAVAALLVDRGLPAGRGAVATTTISTPSAAVRRSRGRSGLAAATRREVALLAGLSGMLVLSAEVVWTRMFAQVLQNSVYTFSLVLVVMLLALAAGALAAHCLARADAPPRATLMLLSTCGGLAVAATPWLFMTRTGGMSYVGGAESWGRYVVAVAVDVTVVVFLPCAVIGTIFPFLLRFAQEQAEDAGRLTGRLAAWNTAGAIAGSLLTGFVWLPALGLWGTVRALAVAYAVAGCVPVWRSGRLSAAAWPVAGAAICALLVDPGQLLAVRVSTAEGERLLDVREGAHGITAVLERPARGTATADAVERRIKVNNYYTLGGSAAVEHERNQALIPLMSHPAPRSVFFLGMGTGITAGAAVHPAVERIVVAELIPDVITAARTYFTEWTNGLFTDPRVTVIAADGRNRLAGRGERFDLIIADLFIPWEAGTGSLYTLEHFATVRSRLTTGGAFVQWLPLYQLSAHEFEIIARTMLSVFPQVVMWRGDFIAGEPILALVGSEALAPLDPSAIVANGRALTAGRAIADRAFKSLVLPFYAGNLAAARVVSAGGPIATDDWPAVEYSAPMTHRRERAGEARWFSGSELAAFYARVLDAVPPAADPYLARLSDEDRALVQAGFHYYAGNVAHEAGDTTAADAHGRAFRALVPDVFRPSAAAPDRSTVGQ